MLRQCTRRDMNKVVSDALIKVLSKIISEKSGSDLSSIAVALENIRKAGYRVVDADRIIDLRTIKVIPNNQINNVEFLGCLKCGVAVEIGQYLLETNGIKFTQQDINGEVELRAAVCVVYPRLI